MCLNGTLSCVDFMDVTMEDIPISAAERSDTIARQADIVAAMTLEVLKGTTKAFESGMCFSAQVREWPWRQQIMSDNLLNIVILSINNRISTYYYSCGDIRAYHWFRIFLRFRECLNRAYINLQSCQEPHKDRQACSKHSLGFVILP